MPENQPSPWFHIQNPSPLQRLDRCSVGCRGREIANRRDMYGTSSCRICMTMRRLATRIWLGPVPGQAPPTRDSGHSAPLQDSHRRPRSPRRYFPWPPRCLPCCQNQNPAYCPHKQTRVHSRRDLYRGNCIWLCNLKLKRQCLKISQAHDSTSRTHIHYSDWTVAL